MAVDLHGTGVAVRLVLPGAFDTEIWDRPDNDVAPYSGPLAPPEEGAAGIVECIGSDRFEHYIPDMRAVVVMKTKDIDGFMEGMRAMVDAAPEPTTRPTPGPDRAGTDKPTDQRS